MDYGIESRDACKKKLKDAMDVFIGPFEHYGKITEAIKNLEQVFFSITGMDPFTRPQEYDSESNTGHGVAIAPTFAGMCVREFMRTWYYLKGMYTAIKSMAAKFPGERIRVLYAGSGPFATLFIPLTACFSAQEISFTLVDIHPQAMACVEKLIAGLDIADYVDECVVADVLCFKPPAGKMYHLAVTETMNQALRKEPQVAITQHVYPFLVPGGVFVPQRVIVSAAVTDADRENPGLLIENGENRMSCISRPYIDLGVVYELIPGMKDYPAKIFRMPPLKNRNNYLMLLTKIIVFADVELTLGMCSLTLPYRYGYLYKLPAAEAYEASYEICAIPGIRLKPLT